MIKLKPCPFCGSVAITLEKVNFGETQVCCTNCGAKADSYLYEKSAIDAWNRRMNNDAEIH